MAILKFCRLFLILVPILSIASMIFLFNRHRTLSNHNTQQEVLRQKLLQSRLEVKGFKFDRSNSGENILSIKADKFTIEKKKLGFFRLGLINVAIFENAVIDVYLKRKSSGDESKPLGDDWDFLGEDLPSLRDAFPSFSKKRISSIIIEPVCLNLQGERSLLTQLTAKSAIVRLKNHGILFKGGVRVVSGDKSLITERLNFSPENFVMKTKRHFILKTSDKKLEGNQLTVDFFLNPVKDKTIRKPDDPNRSAPRNSPPDFR